MCSGVCRRTIVRDDGGRDGDAGQQRDHDHQAEADRHGPRRGLAHQDAEPAVRAPGDASGRVRCRRTGLRRRSPAIAPGAVSPRHQMPSISSGQNVDAASAKANVTELATEIRSDDSASTRAARTPPAAAEPQCRDGREPRRGRSPWPMTPAIDIVSPDEVDKNAANAPAVSRAASSSPPLPPSDPGRQLEHDGVGPAGGHQVAGVDAAEDAVDRGQQVERAEQREHDQGRAPGSAAVGVGVEPDDDVRQAHRARGRSRS